MLISTIPWSLGHVRTLKYRLLNIGLNQSFIPPNTNVAVTFLVSWGVHIVIPLTVCACVCMYVTHFSTVLVFATPPTVFDFWFRTLLQNSVPLNDIHILPYLAVILFVSPQLLLQYLIQGFKICYTVQACIWYVPINTVMVPAPFF